MSVVGGAALSAFFSVLFDKLASQFLEHIKNLGVDDTQLQRLKNTITTVSVVLSNADELQFLNPLVKQLMDELNDVIYLAEDLVDEVNYLVVAKHQGKCKTSIMNFNDKFEKMILKLENAVKHRDIFDLMKKGIGEKTSPRLPTTSLVDESKTYLDKSLVMRFLMNGNAVVESFDSTKDIFKALGKVEHLRTMLPLSISTTSGRTNQSNQIKNIATNFIGAKKTLVLAHCTNLIELPKDLGNLINLGYIDLRETESLERMPPAFGKLENLQTLTKFVVSSCVNGSNISELGKLLHLHGDLSISELQNVKNDIDVENANLEDKKNLKELVFVWDKTVACDISKATVVLEKLRPHENIEKFACKNCLSLPSLGQLSSLEELYVEGMDNLQSIGSEFYGGPSSVTSFDYLHILKFVNMPVWKEWLSPAIADQQFSKLFKLDLLNCENLTGKLLPCYLPLLEELYMEDCLKLKFPCDDGNIKYEKLRILKIENSSDELWAFDLNSFQMLEDLFIDNCSLLINIRIPKEAHLSIKKLEIRNCNNFRGFLDYYAAHFPSIMTLSISHCRELLSFPKGGLPSNLQSLLIEKCHLVTAMDAWGLNNMASLTHLTIIGGSPGLNLKSFPAKGLLPASLTSLVFGEFRELEILDLNGLELLSSLEMMEIKTCVRLRSMSEEGRLPNSLSSLEITECLMLTERCQYGGEDWEKISRITNKVINGEVMLEFVLHLSGNNSWPAFAFHSVHLTQIQQQPYEFDLKLDS
ncbi:hypothetical protein EZV62_017264 [Acer yangbiense]|uniref:Uncharacterized protein n=1 Tax=Acer yangbiense TaxID=1000413 RepID=A0A5C7HG69_9ROSI|nr:hypothetical protein EZV62_017264 [Acer yangbiense]